MRCFAVRSLLATLLVFGCRHEPMPQADVVSQTVERGPLKLSVAAGPRDVQVGDTLAVSLTVETPEGYDVQFPGEKDFGELTVRGGAPGDPLPGAKGLQWRRSYSIEPLVSGALEIPPLAVKYGRREPEVASQPALANELVSEALKLEVRSALTAQDNPEQPRDITGPLLPPRPPLSPWQWGVVAATTVVAIAAVYVAYQVVRRRLLRPPPPILPEVWALRALAELASFDWFEHAREREYYYRLTEIVRSYIERKFGLAAPERTTEEFLGMLVRRRSALPYDAQRLRDFLEACDVVKYAALEPRREDADGALATARAFVHATAAAAGCAEPAPAASTRPAEESAA